MGPGSTRTEIHLKSWRSRIAVAAAVGREAFTIPLTAGSASAAITDPDGSSAIGGSRSHRTCQMEGKELLAEGRYREFRCRWNDPFRELRAR
ncbi:hypothetical protein ACFWVP_30460 [Streptomyces sp. NPDC058637]|uniref:hypothetical protein n=1 Tax=Streptomyces sp. NPDC058637 TaxID=3346569 RepID=UPI003664CF1B